MHQERNAVNEVSNDEEAEVGELAQVPSFSRISQFSRIVRCWIADVYEGQLLNNITSAGASEPLLIPKNVLSLL